ncbi:hypothetical protein METBIDRAFT_13030 [Metschnikowia bicuspidata var. bicuspidata NRRL YB-4993]|uniref:Uncharacterized protein n=1 Tax=Metschnikowia bicuspidata var. bicuspidata NRRL YB-4993 TaxID=869754 RepID=A0A1A0H7X8_9ASCO|nr:hypothetical protein METBIDRAFT_13030 [Metschnikowia bicuspidata var. bicuspidata NRRL YB-4993]OBA20003.1 hypothetical protein METBIDRAFT_13030 [Metschnikowia bicuspidata var. bicuspidata NRRL YB-4993]
MDKEPISSDKISSPASPKDTQEEDPDDIPILQSKKAELIQERDILAQKRLELKQSIERLSASLSFYREQQLQHETKQKLEYYLHKNDHECSKLTQPDEAASFILKNLDVLPTTDVHLRMKLLNRFYPCMSVAQEHVLTIHEEDVLFTVIRFKIFAHGLPPLAIRLHSNDDAVHRLELLDYSEVAPIFQKVSPSFCKTLINNYCRQKKIDMIMHSYHSLAKLQQSRIMCLSQLLLKYADLVTRPKSWASYPELSLMSLNHIELTIPESTNRDRHIVQLSWEMILKNTAIGEMESQLRFSVQRRDSGPLKNVNEVFLSLMLEHGIMNAFSLMLSNLFGV